MHLRLHDTCNFKRVDICVAPGLCNGRGGDLGISSVAGKIDPVVAEYI